jgi:type III secretion protein V
VNALHALAWRLRGAGDVVLAALALATVSVLVAPVPPWLLDLLLAANLALAAMVLVVALFAREALRFASFPTLLLFTTLYRLALEIASTRLVLARGEGGRVIQAFGQVVVQGSYVVGAVVFAIVTLVQLLVVAKGAERVAEVAARFTLDALPGKQMSIDADVRAGAIDQAEARRRRRALEREGQLYGAMDGALKFVKGDALAGVVIVLVNVAGGLVAGITRGLPLEAAARRYALLAIGDGLAAQVPALLVSVAAGVAVTRVAAEDEGGSLSEDIARQLFTDPRALGAVAGLCAALAVVPGLPAAPFLTLSAAAAIGAATRAHRPTVTAGSGAGHAGAADVVSGVAHISSAASPLLVLELAADLAALARADGGRFSSEALSALRDDLVRDLGVMAPEIALRSAPLPPGTWRLLLDDVPAGSGRAAAGEALALASPGELQEVGISCAAELEPLTGARVARIALADAPRAAALAPVRAPLERVAAGAAAALRAHAHLLVGIQEVQALLDALEPSHPALVREASRAVPAPVLAEVLRQLLEEGISIRPLRRILEAVLEAGGARAPVALTEACRRTLRRHIAYTYAGAGPLEALLIDPAAELELRNTLAGGVLALDPQAARTLLDDLSSALATGNASGPVLLTVPELRRPVRQLVATRFPRVAVLSYEELPPSLVVRPVGKVRIAAP